MVSLKHLDSPESLGHYEILYQHALRDVGTVGLLLSNGHIVMVDGDVERRGQIYTKLNQEAVIRAITINGAWLASQTIFDLLVGRGSGQPGAARHERA